MNEISNKTLLVLALVMIFISLGGTWISLSKINAISATGRVPAQVDLIAAEKIIEIDENKINLSSQEIKINKIK